MGHIVGPAADVSSFLFEYTFCFVLDYVFAQLYVTIFSIIFLLCLLVLKGKKEILILET
jgi:hypothetical protein